MPREREEVIKGIERRFRWRTFNEATDAVHPITMRRIHPDGDVAGSSIGTSFLVNRPNHGWFLVSNYHNYSGLDLKGKRIGSFCPNFVDVEFRSETPGEREGFVKLNSASLRYRLVDEDETPLYWHMLSEDEELRGDIAVLPIDIPNHHPTHENCKIKTSHRAFWELNSGANLSVGEECFIVGYPRGLRGDGRLPIWKRGSIATEPVSTWEGKLIFLVDTATREGMSGSPVVVRKIDIDSFSGTRSQLDDLESMTRQRIVGIYSGRIGTDELAVQLGLVWPIDLLDIVMDSVPNDVVPERPIQTP